MLCLKFNPSVPFYDADSQYKDIDSRKLLRKVKEAITEKGRKIANIDSTIVAQAPRLEPYLPQMIVNISTDLGIPADSINIKPTTTENGGKRKKRHAEMSAKAVLLRTIQTLR